jgi:hypothetical protein
MNNWLCWLPKCRCNHMLKIHDTIVVMVSWNWIGTSCCSKRVDQCFAGCALELLWGLFDSEQDLVPQISWVCAPDKKQKIAPGIGEACILQNFLLQSLSPQTLVIGMISRWIWHHRIHEWIDKQMGNQLSLHITAFRSLIFLIQKYWNNNEIVLLKLRWISTCRVEDLIFLFQIYQQRFIHMPSSLLFL